MTRCASSTWPSHTSVTSNNSLWSRSSLNDAAMLLSKPVQWRRNLSGPILPTVWIVLVEKVQHSCTDVYGEDLGIFGQWEGRESGLAAPDPFR